MRLKREIVCVTLSALRVESLFILGALWFCQREGALLLICARVTALGISDLNQGAQYVVYCIQNTLGFL